MICKYCGDDDGRKIVNGGVEIPMSSPLCRSWVCNECAERGDDWFHDSDMEDR